MDSLITAAARALAVGDPLGALNRIALREDPPALALRGTAMAQLGDLSRARALLRKAARAYGPREALSRARCMVAEAEIALARAARAARQARIPALAAEVAAATLDLTAPAARLVARGTQRDLRLEEVEALLSSKALVVDACRFTVRQAGIQIELARRPVLFTLARALAEQWPADVPREALVARAFRAKRADESYRARLRVEVGRLRRALRSLASVVATREGFAIRPRRADEVVVLAQPAEGEHAAVLALLTDGQSWSTSALSLALGVSARTVQRALGSLAGAGKVQTSGRGRARRWLTPPPLGFTTTLLLPAPLLKL